jgi:uncharacterized cupredoxin-like copper-binding protein
MKLRRVYALLAAGGLLASCSGGTPSASAGAPSASAAAPASVGAPSASAGAPSASAGGTSTVSAALKEWQISLSSTSLSAGKITFTIDNNGDKEHEFVVRKTDRQADSLPLNADGEVSEDAPELTAVGDPSELAEIKAGTTANTLTVTLQPGHYVIFCNLHVGELLHYKEGMHVDLAVK